MREPSWMFLRWPVVLLALALAGCVTATPYQPRNDRGHGYSEQKIESNRYRITFAGNSATPREIVENYLLYRAAEVTLSQGYDYFVLASRQTDADTRYQQTMSAYPGFGYGYYYWYPAFSVGVSSTQTQTEYAAQADVVMFKGAKNDQDTRAFNAADVRINLQPQVRRADASAP